MLPPRGSQGEGRTRHTLSFHVLIVRLTTRKMTIRCGIMIKTALP